MTTLLLSRLAVVDHPQSICEINSSISLVLLVATQALTLVLETPTYNGVIIYRRRERRVA
jgi:hypothetical protein